MTEYSVSRPRRVRRAVLLGVGAALVGVPIAGYAYAYVSERNQLHSRLVQDAKWFSLSFSVPNPAQERSFMIGEGNQNDTFSLRFNAQGAWMVRDFARRTGSLGETTISESGRRPFGPLTINVTDTTTLLVGDVKDGQRVDASVNRVDPGLHKISCDSDGTMKIGKIDFTYDATPYEIDGLSLSDGCNYNSGLRHASTATINGVEYPAGA